MAKRTAAYTDRKRGEIITGEGEKITKREQRETHENINIRKQKFRKTDYNNNRQREEDKQEVGNATGEQRNMNTKKQKK